MKVRVAKSAGFCFGVKRAVQMVYDEAEKNPGKVYTMGPIIHNEQVVGDLSRKGVRMIGDDLICAETGQMPPEGSVIIVRSHGISRRMTEKLQQSGYRIVTATCPFVQKIHDIVAQKSREGYGIIIVGNPGHPEVIGIRGWAEGPCAVVESAEDAKRLAGQSACPEPADESEKSASGGAAFAGNGLRKEKSESENADRLHLSKDHPVWIVSQTTFNYEKFKDIVEIIRKIWYDVKVTNTICNATKERQTESLELAAESDVMIVIGGKNSSNTQKLYEICKSQCGNTYHIQTLEDMSTVQFHNGNRVGITAGASTPNTIIQEVSTHVRGTEL
ncbi:MAG: 4-hydroxy-3-methylbut-2-enyl diphosphate reductase [bacterium]